MKSFRATALALVAIVAVSVSCRSKDDGLAGEWTTRFGSEGLALSLNSDHSFKISSSSTEDFAGRWTVSGGKIHFEVETLGGTPLDQALKAKVAQSGGAIKKSPDQQAAAVESLKKVFKGMTMTISPNLKTLTWEGNGNTEFMRLGTERRSDLADEAQIRSHLRLGMSVHEVNDYFCKLNTTTEASAGDPKLLTENFKLESTSGPPTTVIARYRYVAGTPGLESIEILKGGTRKKIRLRKN